MKNSKFNRMCNRMVKNTVLFLVLLMVSCKGIQPASQAQRQKKIRLSHATSDTTLLLTGAENTRAYLPRLKGLNIGIITNRSGILNATNAVDDTLPNGKIVTLKHFFERDENGEWKKTSQSIVDYLLEQNISLKKIYAPEHGFRGTADAGEHIIDGKDTKTGLPIISLYGNNKKPKPEQLEGIEVMVFDLQDVGARFYTYISSLHYIMEACAENQIPLLVLDRPNPNGSIVDGPVLEKEHTSFVGMHPIPVLHGMTIGEYAQMINGEKWLKEGKQCELTVIPCLNYKREMPYSLPVRPSPNLPNDQSINLYASLCLFEGTNVSVGRGTDLQFQIYGSPFLKNMPFEFTPEPNFGAKEPLHKGQKCYGENLSKIEKVNRFELKWLLKAYELTEDKSLFFNDFFTKLTGTKLLRQQIEAGLTEEAIRATWQKDLAAFKKMRQPYLLY